MWTKAQVARQIEILEKIIKSRQGEKETTKRMDALRLSDEELIEMQGLLVREHEARLAPADEARLDDLYTRALMAEYKTEDVEMLKTAVVYVSPDHEKETEGPIYRTGGKIRHKE